MNSEQGRLEETQQIRGGEFINPRWRLYIYIQYMYVYVCMYVCIYTYIHRDRERERERDRDTHTSDLSGPQAAPSPPHSDRQSRECLGQVGDWWYTDPGIANLGFRYKRL